MCARLDHLLGTLIAALRDEGSYDDTLVVFFADHGDFAGDYGLVEKTQNTFEDCLVRVPLVIKPPKGRAVTPGVREQLAELIDVPATVADLLGIAWPHAGFGRSLAGVVADPACPHRDAVFAEGGRLHGETQCMELKSVGGQTPEGLYWPRLSAQRNEGPEHTKAIMCRTTRYKYVYRHYEIDELYDLETDPMELENRIHDPALAPVAAAMQARIFRWLVETSDVVPLVEDARE
jgi:arylsulfatase A-like enzyme